VTLMVDSLFQSAALWVVRVAGSIADAVVTLEGTSNGVLGEFHKSSGDGGLIEAMTVLLPTV
jgi:hypothetical protein